MQSYESEDPPEGCYHYASLAEVPSEARRYYQQRYSLFSLYDEGIWMTEDAWFGVTPEPVATKIAQHLSQAASPERAVLIDCFAGVGGNTIAFALSGRWRRVYAIEKDPQNLACAKHNAQIYGVENRISWYEGDCFEILQGKLADLASASVVFASPPWGGPGYRSSEVFDLSTMQPYTLKELYDSLYSYSGQAVFYLPRTSDMRQVAKLWQSAEPILVMHYCMEGASKALCVYYGDFGQDLNTSVQ